MIPDRQKIKEKHPNWFKMKIERRELIRQLSPETAVNVLLACWEYLEIGEVPPGLSPIESIAFSAFIPGMEEAWRRYTQRIYARNAGKGVSDDIDRYRPISSDTEEETEPEIEIETEVEREVYGADKPPRASRFTPPTVDEVAVYCQERGNCVDPQRFVDFYAAKGWMVGKNKMKDWRACVRTWEKGDQAKAEGSKAVPSDEDYLKEWGDV